MSRHLPSNCTTITVYYWFTRPSQIQPGLLIKPDKDATQHVGAYRLQFATPEPSHVVPIYPLRSCFHMTFLFALVVAGLS